MFKLFSVSCFFSLFITYGVFSPKGEKMQLKSRLSIKLMQPPTAFQGQNQNVMHMWMLLKDKTHAHKTKQILQCPRSKKVTININGT